jgi:ribonuclease Z
LRSLSDPQFGDYTDLPLNPCESPHGLNIQQSNGIWPDLYKDDSISVSAASILHSVPCLGYVIQESPLPGKLDPNRYISHLKRTKTPMSVMSLLQQGRSVTLSDGSILHGPSRIPGRKIAILGDTYDPSPIAELAADVDVLIHEATNAHLPGIYPNTKEEDTFESVEARSISRGHSTPQMAGKFARSVRAKKLVLNHFSSRYAGNDDKDEDAKKIMDAIGALAGNEFGGSVVCSRDLMNFEVPVPR